MAVREYEAQWQSIIEDNMFSESATITDNESISFEVKGVFFSGSYSEESAAVYAPVRLVEKEYFQLSSSSLPDTLDDPWKALEGMELILTDRDISFRISEVSGKRGGALTLSLQEKLSDE